MAFAAKISSGCFSHLNLLGCLLKKRLTKLVDRHRRTPPPPHSSSMLAYDMGDVISANELHDYKKRTIQFTPTTYLVTITAKDLQLKKII